MTNCIVCHVRFAQYGKRGNFAGLTIQFDYILPLNITATMDVAYGDCCYSLIPRYCYAEIF